MVLVLDGPLGTELLARGVPTPLPGWSAAALEADPDAVRAIHADYARAGARVHTAATFRTQPRVYPDRWQALARAAVLLARAAVPADHRVAGSIAPLADCYRPDLSPAATEPGRTREEHGALARILAAEGCDLLLCETFPHPAEAWIAVEEAVATGLETWVAFTPGYRADLLTPEELARAGAEARARGAAAVLVNCVPADRALDYVNALTDVLGDALPIGVYANAGRPEERMGWSAEPGAPERYAQLARTWVAAGATIVGGCCGTGPAHVAALASARLEAASRRDPR